MILNRLVKLFTSLRLTAVLLAFAILLVFVGTVAQADEGLYNAQTRYFKQWLVMGITMLGKRVPLILPGGYLIGSLLLINLIASHIYRFQFTIKKLGIHLAHGGIILLLVGQLTTDLLSRETQMRLSEGETRSYSESPSHYELVFTSSADQKNNEETVIPGRVLARGGEITDAQLPFAIRVKSYWRYSDTSFRAPMMQNTAALTTNGVAVNFDFHQAPETKKMDEKDAPTGLIEMVGPKGSLGVWVVSAWAGDPMMVEAVGSSYARQAGQEMARHIVDHLTAPQSVEAGGRKFTFTLRPERVYHPFSLTLLKATHTTYPGRPDIPKDFRSRVRIDNPQTGEKREVEIYMNNPLRYAGLTFYQYQMDAGQATEQAGRVPSSTLQVVRNPSWLTPYVGCVLVAVGLIVQFTLHLVRFISRSQAKPGPPAAVARTRKPEMKTV